MTFTLTLRRNKPKIGFDGEPPKDSAVSQIIAWAIDNLEPDEIESLIHGLKASSPNTEHPAPWTMDRRNGLAGDKARKASEASFLKRFPEAARIGLNGMAADVGPASSYSVSSFLERFPEAARIGLNSTYRR